jgi:hypothetical protein
MGSELMAEDEAERFYHSSSLIEIGANTVLHLLLTHSAFLIPAT